MDEVVEEAVLVLQVVREKSQRVADTRENIRGRAKTAMIADAQGRQTKPGGGDAGHGACIVAVRQRAVFHLPGLRTCFEPEKIKGSALNLVQQLVVSSLIRR